MSTAYEKSPTVADALAAALSSKTSFITELKQAGLREGHLRGIIEKKVPENLILIFADRIERIMHLDLRQLTLDQAKHEFWPESDPLEDIATPLQLNSALKTITTSYGVRKVSRLLDCNQDTLRKWVQPSSRPRLASYKLILEVILAHREGRLQSTSHGLTMRRDSNQSTTEADRKEFSAALSALHGLTTILEQQAVRAIPVFDGDRARVVELIRRLAKAVRLTPEALKRLTEQLPLTTQDTQMIEGIIKPKRRS